MLPKEYRTVSDIAGPLMLVEQVAGVKYDELVEMELGDGGTRRVKCWRFPATQPWCRYLKVLPESIWHGQNQIPGPGSGTGRIDGSSGAGVRWSGQPP